MNIPFFMSFLLAIMDFLYGFVPGTAFRQDMLSDPESVDCQRDNFVGK